jgi:UDP-glucose 4-epimerase
MMFGQDQAHEEVNCYNLAVPDQTSVNEIARWTIEEMGLDPERVRIERAGGKRGWPGDVTQVKLDTRRMAALGWRPKMSSGEAVRRTIKECVEELTKA